ncbi:MAG: polysaccharide biosynthesis protein [Ruminococcaceae bacterium]|nr:polysaccharide biosynthesis protein [Oscillospiraceae bacterium]
MSENKNQAFLKGAFILVIANVLVKVIGAGFKIPLTYILGEEGMGLFSTAYTIYGLLFIIATAGLPVAVSKMVSESRSLNKYKEVKLILKVSFMILSVIGILGFLVLFLFAEDFSVALNNPRAMTGIKAIAPAMIFVALMSAFRGFFQGHQDMFPTAVSEVLEALGKLLFGYGFAYYFVTSITDDTFRINFGAMGAVAGVSMGALLGFLALLIIYVLKRKELYKNVSETEKVRSGREIGKKLVLIAIPITIGASVFSLTNIIDMAMIMRRLEVAGFSASSTGLALYGSYTGYAVPLFNMPPTLISSISISVVPAIAGAFVKKENDFVSNLTQKSVKITLLFALPCAVGMSILSKPILSAVYMNTNAANTLSILAIAIVFVSLVMLTNAILQAIGKVYIPVVNMLLGGLLKIVVNYVLVANPHINICGAPIGTNLCYILILTLNIFWIVKLMRVKFSVSSFIIKPLICVAVMTAMVILSSSIVNVFVPFTGRLSSIIIVLFGVSFGAISYFAMLFVTKLVTYDDVLMLPKGEKIANYMVKIRLFKK